jgi:hypothetical protein
MEEMRTNLRLEEEIGVSKEKKASEVLQTDGIAGEKA